LILMILKIQVF